MPTFGQRIAALAWPIIRGADGLTAVTITTQTGETIDHTTGAITPTVVTETPHALVSPFGPDMVDGITITHMDRQILILYVDLVTAPNVNSTVTFQGSTWSMQSPPELVSNDGLWQLHVRQVGQV